MILESENTVRRRAALEWLMNIADTPKEQNAARNSAIEMLRMCIRAAYYCLSDKFLKIRDNFLVLQNNNKIALLDTCPVVREQEIYYHARRRMLGTRVHTVVESGTVPIPARPESPAEVRARSGDAATRAMTAKTPR